MVTKLNVNIRSLLSSCETLAKKDAEYWRLQKLIKSLDIMIDELETLINEGDDTADIKNYRERLAELKTVTNYIESAKSIRKEAAAISPTLSGRDMISELHQLKSGQEHIKTRQALLNEDGYARFRGKDKVPDGEIVKYYNTSQDRITQHMLVLTRNLREQTKIANAIIKRDTKVINASAELTDRNLVSLNKEGTKLEVYSHNTCKCWFWLMIMFVICVFIGMVIFMKLVQKKNRL